MTMDIQKHSRHESKTPELKASSPKIAEGARAHTSNVVSSKSIKRSFDVAFLMMPDEKLKQRQMEKQQKIQESLNRSINNGRNPESKLPYDQKQRHNNNDSPDELNEALGITTTTAIENSIRINRYLYQQSGNRNSKIFEESLSRNLDRGVPNYERTSNVQKSAFTKVAYLGGKYESLSGNSPAPSTSPDHLSCPGSLSPPTVPSSPPVMNYIPKTPNYPFSPVFKTQHHNYPVLEPGYQTSSSSIQTPFSRSFNQIQHDKSDSKFQPILSYSPYLNSNPYQFPAHNFPSQNPELFRSGAIQQTETSGIMRSPAAAAILSSLLPPSFATFSLPAQNVCAKCNISFRMTSDLVYHMRSHHKSEVHTDMSRRRREDKLKCPVCCESFRERHHLTRHMTAHQDKEGDILDAEPNGGPSNFPSGKKQRYGFQNGCGGK